MIDQKVINKIIADESMTRAEIIDLILVNQEMTKRDIIDLISSDSTLEQINRYRVMNNIPVAEICRAAGMSVSTYYATMNGQTATPSWETMQKLLVWRVGK